MTLTLFACDGGRLELPDRSMVLVDRRDGGHLVALPPRDVWDRGELAPRGADALVLPRGGDRERDARRPSPARGGLPQLLGRRELGPQPKRGARRPEDGPRE